MGGSSKKHKEKREKKKRKRSRSPELQNEEVEHSGQAQLSLSVQDTNKLRAQLGLKPLEEAIPGLGGDDELDEKGEVKEVFVKTENISDIKEAEKFKEKLKTTREKRKITDKLRKVKTLGESDSDDDGESAAAWVQRNRKIQEQKKEAEKRAKLLEEMDAEFGISALVDEEFGINKKKNYSSRDLRGLTVAHDSGSFKEGQRVILTLKDKGVLEEDDDVLQNVNIVDEERYAKNVENRKRKPDYQPYEEEYDEFGILKKKNMLSKYDEEIHGAKKKTFTLGVAAPLDREKELEIVRMKLKQQQQVTLEMPNLRLANEYYTQDDMVQFKKPKRRRKIQKSSLLKADDLMEMNSGGNSKDLGSRQRKSVVIKEETDNEYLYGEDNEASEDIKIKSEAAREDLSHVVIEEESAEKDLHDALTKTRKLRQMKVVPTPEKAALHIKTERMDEDEDEKAAKAGPIVLNSVAEFCRTLGDIPTYGMSGNRDEDADELIDFERELMEERQKAELDALSKGAWNEVNMEDQPAEITIRENEPILEEEPDITVGVAGALEMAQKKGYLDKDNKKLMTGPRGSSLQAQSYTIEEKFYEDDKFGKRDRYTGPIQDFREKGSYKPDVKLEYIDDSGRLLNAKEAFRYLSHKFHGKGPGKNKVDKRMKKLDQDTKLKQMSSTDTPLNTVKLLQQKQKETHSPFIVLSGGSKTLTQTMISKK